MKVRTAVSKVTGDDVVVRGEKLSALVEAGSFTDAVFLLLAARKPDAKESRLFGAILTSIVDHGAGTASALSARFVASTGNPLNASVAAGVLALGDLHGGAIEGAMRQMASCTDPAGFVKDSLARRERLLGFGHKVHPDEDPRVTRLWKLCSELGYESGYVDRAFLIEQELEVQKGRKLCLNIDGFIAAVLLEMGFPHECGKGVFLIGRAPGLVAHAVEEVQRERPVRRLAEDDVEYDG